MIRRMSRMVAQASCMAAALIVGSALEAQQAGTVTGLITDEVTLAPLPTVQVFLQGTSRGGLTNQEGRFTLNDVPPGSYTLVAQRIGYQEARQANVTVAQGQATSVNLAMSPTVLSLQAVVATGLIDPVEGVRSPISVARVSRELMPVAVAGNAIQNLQGRVAGVQMNRTSGQPGEDVSIMLRTPTSLRGTGAPMIVVDGVILGGVLSDATTSSIEGMDIESVEIIRGAAAASLYGSRAAAGVIAITTARGRELEQGRTRFTARSEYGFSEPIRGLNLPRHHHYLMNAAGTSYVNAQGQEVSRADRVAASSSTHLQFMDQPYPGPVFNNVSAVLQPGAFQAHNLQLSQNTASTNFAASLSRTHDQGALEGNDGYYRNSVRLNLDHRFLNALSMMISMSHARDGRHNIAVGSNATEGAFTGGALFTNVLNAPVDIDLSARDARGFYVQQPDPAVGYENPLWAHATRESRMHGNRTLLSTQLTWSPLAWISTEGLVSYDRREQTTRNLVPKGTPASVGQEGELDGSLAYNGLWTDTWNGSGQVSLRHTLGLLNARVTFRGLVESDRTELGNRTGEGFLLYGVPHLSNIAPANRSSTSSEREVKALGYLIDTGLDYDGKYTATILGRTDGSSLFGVDARWRNYYRVAGAWRMAEEPWFNLPDVDEFKVSYAIGTAGGRPSWNSQYETWNLTEGLPTKGQLGNRNLRPEHTTEQEASLNMILFGRYGIVLTHAWQETKDQIVPATLPGYVGYGTQIVNAGTVAGHTTELSIEAQMLQRRNLGWTSMLVADYSESHIKEWPLPCDASRTWRYDCAGEPVYGIYGFRLLRNPNELRDHRGGGAVPFADQFQVNDEGYLVWVGDKDYRDGMVNGVVQPGTWGTTSPDIGGRTYQWGIPFFDEDETGATKRPSLGTGSPLNVGWVNNVRYGGFNFHAQLHGSVGGVANNRAFQDLINGVNRNFPGMDQSGKPDGLKKPIAYYTIAVGSGGSTYITERADYLKLRTLSVNYRLANAQLHRIGLQRTGMESVQIGITGRNVLTFTNFTGWDPEQALNLNDRLNSFGTGTYPTTRTWTADVSIVF